MRQAALVELRRASDPLRPRLTGTGYANRNAFVGPAGPGRPGPGPARRPAGEPRPREEWIPIRVPAFIDESTHQGASRSTRPQLGPVVPQQHPQRLPAAVPVDLPDVRPGDVRDHVIRQAGAEDTSILQLGFCNPVGDSDKIGKFDPPGTRKALAQLERGAYDHAWDHRIPQAGRGRLGPVSATSSPTSANAATSPSTSPGSSSPSARPSWASMMSSPGPPTSPASTASSPRPGGTPRPSTVGDWSSSRKTRPLAPVIRASSPSTTPSSTGMGC